MTMYIAKLARPIILPALKDSPPEWAYEDRVLVMLAPSLRDNVAQFHEGQGADMVTMFLDHQIEHIDGRSSRSCAPQSQGCHPRWQKQLVTRHRLLAAPSLNMRVQRKSSLGFTVSNQLAVDPGCSSA
jgi:hypothetical protein